MPSSHPVPISLKSSFSDKNMFGFTDNGNTEEI